MARRISARDEKLLVELVQYLNLEEMRTFCRAHELPLYIHVERPDGRLRRTGDRDRKDIVLDRILRFALHGERTGPTIYRKGVVSDAPLPSRPTARTRLHYGQYDKKNPAFLDAMKRLTGGEFRSGMIAKITVRDFWIAGVAPTLSEFAAAWERATEAHTQPRPEGAYLADMARGEVGSDWKEVRRRKAARALGMMDALVP